DFDALLDQCMINYLQECNSAPEINGFLSFLERVEPFSSQWAYTESYVRVNTAKKWGVKNGI
ncbi:hypothetical protein, partial [Pseudomonas protegens]